jgi:hypothetical protein
MTILMSAENPTGHKLEDLLVQLQAEIIAKNAKIVNDHNPVAARVRSNNYKILANLAEAEAAQRDSYRRMSQLRPDEGPLGVPRLG